MHPSRAVWDGVKVLFPKHSYRAAFYQISRAIEPGGGLTQRTRRLSRTFFPYTHSYATHLIHVPDARWLRTYVHMWHMCGVVPRPQVPMLILNMRLEV